MEFLDPKLEEYIERYTEQENELLKNLNRETHLKVMKPRMLSGHLQGRVLSMLSQMIQPEIVLEIGTYTGYSALCMAEGLKKGGKVITIDRNEELKSILDKYIGNSEYNDQIDIRFGNAMEIIPQLDVVPDLVFIDADKENYSNYYDLVIEKMKPGGYILADNVLWSGKVIQPVKETDKSTKAIVEFNQKVHADDRVQNVLLPVRDGLMVLKKV